VGLDLGEVDHKSYHVHDLRYHPRDTLLLLGWLGWTDFLELMGSKKQHLDQEGFRIREYRVLVVGDDGGGGEKDDDDVMNAYSCHQENLQWIPTYSKSTWNCSGDDVVDRSSENSRVVSPCLYIVDDVAQVDLGEATSSKDYSGNYPVALIPVTEKLTRVDQE